MIGDLGTNSSFYHKRCSTNRFTKTRKEEDRRNIDVDQVKAAAWDKIIAFMNETSPTDFFDGFDIHDLENMYHDYLSEYEVYIDSYIKRFGRNLIERAPNYEIIKYDKNNVFC